MTPRTAAALGLVTVLSAVTSAHAQASVQVQVVPPQPAAGQMFRVVYRLSVRNRSGVRATPLVLTGLRVLSNPAPPSTDGMMVFGGGPNVMMSLDTQVEYVVQAPGPGRYTITGASVVDEQTGQVVFRAPPLRVEVTAGAPQPVQPAPPPQPPPGMFPPGMFPPGIFPPGMVPQPPQQPVIDSGPDVPPPGTLSPREVNLQGFVRVAVDKPMPYVGEQLTWRAWLYIPGNDAGCEFTREPSLDGFWSEVLWTPRQQCVMRWIPQNVGSQFMSAGMLRRIALFPTHAGRLEVGSLHMRAEYIEGDAFFGQRRMVEIHGPSIIVEAREPPTQGRPANYVPGLMGPLRLEAEINRTRLPVGETAVLTLRVHGNGYLGSVQFPAPRPVDGVRMTVGAQRFHSDASAEPVQGELAIDVRVVPTRPGRIALGRLEVPYFDPATTEYHTYTLSLPTLDVTGEALPAHGDGDDPQEDPAVALDAYDPSPALDSANTIFSTGFRAWGAIALPPLALALTGLARVLRRWRRTRDAERDDTARNDPGALLDQASAALAKGDPREAAALAGRALDRARRSAERVDDATAATVRDVAAQCDTLRFSGDGDAAAILAAARRAVDALARGDA